MGLRQKRLLYSILSYQSSLSFDDSFYASGLVPNMDVFQKGWFTELPPDDFECEIKSGLKKGAQLKSDGEDTPVGTQSKFLPLF